MNIIFIAGISIAIFFEFLLLSKKQKNLSDKILSLWMLLISIHLFLFYMLFTERSYTYTFLLGLSLPLPLIHGCFSYFYVAAATHQFPKKKFLVFLHFIPLILTYIYLLPFYGLSGAEKVFVFQNDGVGYETFLKIFPYIFTSVGIFYIIWSLILLKRHRQRILNQYANLESVNLNWLRLLVWGMGAIWLLSAVSDNDPITFLGVSCFVFLIGFFGIKQIGLINPLPQTENTQKSSKKYAKSGLKKDQSEALYNRLNALMEDERLYTKNDLLINDLAEKLEVHSNSLSQLINEYAQKNFYEYVNAYRFSAFNDLIQDPEKQKFTLLSLAYECGFNSKSSFNRYIKKATGLTPSEYYQSKIKNSN